MDKTRTSKLISLVLRHKPEVIGITLDEHGWANVADLIAGVNRIRPLTMELLEEIVRTDDKQRFSFNGDKTRIRANQGHSIPVDVELEELEPPEYLWHGTGEKYRESIEQNGLIAKTRLYVHLSADREMAVKVGARHGRPIVFQVSTGQMHRDGHRFYRSVNGVWLTKYVPAVYLQLMPDQSQLQAEPSNGPQLELTDRQLKICHAVVGAAAALEKQYDIDLYTSRFQVYPTVDEPLARGIRQFFDLYQMAVGEKHDGLRHVTNIEDTASLIAAYSEAFSSISGGEFSEEEVVGLRKLFVDYLKVCAVQDKNVILGARKMSPEDKQKLTEMAQIIFKDAFFEVQEEEQQKRRANYKPRNPRQKQIDPDTFTRECVEQAEIPVTDSTVGLARRLYDICDEKEFVVGTLRCARNPDAQSKLMSYLNNHDNPSPQDVALYVYNASGS